MIFISFSVNAMSTGLLYKSCKPLQNNGFQSGGLSRDNMLGGLSCTSYVSAMVNAGRKNCSFINNLKKVDMGVPLSTLEIMSKYTANSDADVHAVIASFTNSE